MGKKKSVRSKEVNKAKEKIDGLLSAAREHMGLERADDELRKLDQICEEYNLEDNEKKYLGLAYLLALDYHPIFKNKKKSKTSAKWTHSLEALLVVQIESLRNTPNNGITTITEAAEKLAESDLWSRFLKVYDTEFGIPRDKKSENLRKQYPTAKKKDEVKLRINNLLSLKEILDDETWETIISSKD